jgi:hypothetical protein
VSGLNEVFRLCRYVEGEPSPPKAKDEIK